MCIALNDSYNLEFNNKIGEGLQEYLFDNELPKNLNVYNRFYLYILKLRKLKKNLLKT